MFINDLHHKATTRTMSMACVNGLNMRDGNTVAKQRWKLLGKALRNQQFKKESAAKNVACDVSVRRFNSYGLLVAKQLTRPPSSTSLTQSSASASSSSAAALSSSSSSRAAAETEDYTWFQYSSPSHEDFCIFVRHLKQQFTLEELIGFNNTGNVCIWPSEEVLAHHCLVHRDLFRGKTVCELGGGMTCLAGIAVACTSDAARVILTDGNDLSCKNIAVIVEENKEKLAKTDIHVRKMRWNEETSFTDLRGSVDVILCADCLFFDQYRTDLVNTIHSLLINNGMAIIFAPQRNRTLEDFCQQARSVFHLIVEDNYDPVVWSVFQQAKMQGKGVFDEDIHYPLKITLTKKGHSAFNNENRGQGQAAVNVQEKVNGHLMICNVNGASCSSERT